MSVAALTDDELHDVIRHGITAARNGKKYDRRAFLAAMAEFKRRERASRRALRTRHVSC